MALKLNHDYHIVELTRISNDALDWCIEQFGFPDAGRWFNRGTAIYFADSRDHLMFVIRWA
jgi:hypothetical protein